jgi:hypothetical protein
MDGFERGGKMRELCKPQPAGDFHCRKSLQADKVALTKPFLCYGAFKMEKSHG